MIASRLPASSQTSRSNSPAAHNRAANAAASLVLPVPAPSAAAGSSASGPRMTVEPGRSVSHGPGPVSVRLV
jgi:hypothetical protein